MKYDILRPKPDSLLQSVRSFGYTIETAIADLIDNSITAGASKININYSIDKFSAYVRIEDNGKGMQETALLNAMRVGSFNPLDERSENDLGRFGLGLKTASFSQCKRLTVKTNPGSGKEFVRCWDLDIVAKEQEWVLLQQAADNTSVNNLGSFSSSGGGTIVLLEKLDRLVESGEFESVKEHFYRKFDNVRKHLGLIFHRFIEDGELTISVLGDPLEAVNPFHLSAEIPSTELAEEHLSINRQPISIQPFILPHESKLPELQRKALDLTRGWIEHQGIYLYRNRRMIADGTWLDLGFRQKESQRLCRIRIDIPNTLDKEWQIDVKKATAKIPDVIRKRIKTICVAAIDRAVKVYTQRGAYVKRKGDKKEIVYLWSSKQKQGKRYYEINKAHPIYQLIAEHLEDDAYIFDDFIRLVGETLPINFIVTDFSDPTTTMKDFFEGDNSDLRKIYQNTIAALTNAGIPEAEAITKVNGLECFQQLIKP